MICVRNNECKWNNETFRLKNYSIPKNYKECSLQYSLVWILVYDEFSDILKNKLK